MEATSGNGQAGWEFVKPPFDDTLFEELHDIGKETPPAAEPETDPDSLFIVQPASVWMKQANARPIPRMLFGEFWFEGELCIPFADTNVGKSILGVQIADSISSGRAIPGFPMEAPAQPVIYFDFELSDKQFENRYSINYTSHYQFHPNFLRAEINPNGELPPRYGKDIEAFINDSIEREVIKTGAKILIVDNITYLANETEKAKGAAPLMKHLKRLKKAYGLSILALAHTPKRDPSKPIVKNDLSGSRQLMAFTDSSFAIGESEQDNSVRYIKQIKVRQKEFQFDSENVCVCLIEKPGNFLLFKFLSFGTEREHLKQVTETDKKNREEEALQMRAQGVSNVEIARKFSVSEGAVRKWFKKADSQDSEA